MTDMSNIHKEITIPNRIFLKGFDPSTKEDDLHNIFLKYGSIIETKIIREPTTGESKGFGFITFDSQLVAENVITSCKTVELCDREIAVGPAKIRRRPPVSRMPPRTYHGNPGFVPYSVSPDGLFTFHQQPYVHPASQSTLPGYQKPAFVDQMPAENHESVMNYNDHFNRTDIKINSIHKQTESSHKERSEERLPNRINSNIKHPVNQPRKSMLHVAAHSTNQYPVSELVNAKIGSVVTQQQFSTAMAHENQGNIAITVVNGGMSNQVVCGSLCCFPFATIVPAADIKHGNVNTVRADANASISNQESSGKVLSAKTASQTILKPTNDLKEQKYVFMSTGLGKVKRVVVQA